MSSPAEDKHLPADRLTAVTKGAGRGHSESERGKALWSPALPDACPRAQSLLNIPLPLGTPRKGTPRSEGPRSGSDCPSKRRKERPPDRRAAQPRVGTGQALA